MTKTFQIGSLEYFQGIIHFEMFSFHNSPSSLSKLQIPFSPTTPTLPAFNPHPMLTSPILLHCPPHLTPSPLHLNPPVTPHTRPFPMLHPTASVKLKLASLSSRHLLTKPTAHQMFESNRPEFICYIYWPLFCNCSLLLKEMVALKQYFSNYLVPVGLSSDIYCTINFSSETLFVWPFE